MYMHAVVTRTQYFKYPFEKCKYYKFYIQYVCM